MEDHLNNSRQTASYYQILSPWKLEEILPPRISGRAPMSMADVLTKRIAELNVENPTYEDQVRCKSWWETNIVTGDSLVHHPNGNVKFNYSSNTLWDEITWRESRQTSQGKVVEHSDEKYRLIEGPEFSAAVVEKYGSTEANRTIEQQMENPLYVEGVAKGDKALAREYLLAGAKRRSNDVIAQIYVNQDAQSFVYENLLRVVGQNDIYGGHITEWSFEGGQDIRATMILVPAEIPPQDLGELIQAKRPVIKVSGGSYMFVREE